jgi:hypothetical protein
VSWLKSWYVHMAKEVKGSYMHMGSWCIILGYGMYNYPPWPRLSQPHFEGVVKSPFTLPKMGLGSPLRLPKTQSVIEGVKLPCVEAFFIPLKRSWSVDVQNGLAWAIWTSAAQVVVERRVGSQTGSLTPDH